MHHVMADGNFLKKGRKTVRSCLLVKRPGSGLGSLDSGAMSFGAPDTYTESQTEGPSVSCPPGNP